MTPSPARDHVRRIGALAGLAPALAAIAVLIVLGASPTGDAILWFAGITVVAIGIGWLIGPRVTSSFPSDLSTAVAYALAGSLVYLLVGATISIWAGPAIVGDRLPGLVVRVAGQLAYGMLYVPFLAIGLTPFGLVWVVAVRALRQRAGIPAAGTAARVANGRRFARSASTGRLGWFAAALIVAFGLFVAVLPLLLYHEPRSPWSALPPRRPVRPVLRSRRDRCGRHDRAAAIALIAAGVVCLLQASVSFSRVTFGFLVPAVLLLALGIGDRGPATPPEPRRAYAVSAAVVALTVRRLGRRAGPDRGRVLDVHGQP